jgi:polyisoprenoid-binding protein YceI
MMVSNVKGEFATYSGTIDIDEKDVTKSSVKVTIDTASIDTRIAKRDEHLRSADFFNVATFPTMTFVSKKVQKITVDHLSVTGDLTIRGVTKEVVLDVTNFTQPVLDPTKKIRRGASAMTKINRKDFGLAWNKVMETGGVVVGEEVTIALEIEMIRQ